MNIIVLGDKGVGKTSFINKCFNSKFYTISEDLQSINVSNCAIIMFDLTNVLSFKNTFYWYNYFKNVHPEGLVVFCGNKIDESTHKCLSLYYVMDKISVMFTEKITYYEISVKNDFNLSAPFRHLSNLSVKHTDDNTNDNSINLLRIALVTVAFVGLVVNLIKYIFEFD